MDKKQIVSEISESVIAALPKLVNPLKEIPKPILKETGKYDEEQFGLLLSDFQVGHRTKTYDNKVFNVRMDILTQKVVKIAHLHRKSHPVKVLNIFLLGDLVQNERIGYLISLDELEGVIKQQVFEWVIPTLSKAISILAQDFEKINLFCVRGNHGGQGRFAATTTNWDDVVYHFLEQYFKSTARIKFTIADNFYLFAEIYKWKFLLVHGDQIPFHMTLPYYGLTTRAMRWKGSIGAYDFLAVGHFHSFAHLCFNDLEILMNGAIVSDDDWVKKVIGLDGTCCQTLFSVHPRKGLAFVRKIGLK